MFAESIKITRHLAGFAEVALAELDDGSRRGEAAETMAIVDEAVVGGPVDCEAF